MRIVTWNVNSLRARLDQVLDWVEANAPDVVCLQETKVSDQEFPADELGDLGYDVVFHGQPAYNGVAIATKEESSNVAKGLPGEAAGDQRRLLAVDVGGLRLVNAYVPNGQALLSDKYRSKLEWLERFARFLGEQDRDRLVVCGDFNVAPEELDVFDPEALGGGLLVSEPERAAYRAVLKVGLVDAFRHLYPKRRQFTWWDYRDAGFARDAGLRIDHFLLAPHLLPRLLEVTVDVDARAKEKASDHAPVVLTLGG